MKKNTQKKIKQQDPNLLLRPAYKGQYCTTMKLPASPQVLSTTVTTGVIASTQTIDPTSVLNGWNARFAATFKEYRVVKAVLKMKTFSSVLPGQINSWVDETSVTAPTATQAVEYQGITTYPAGNNERTHTVKWVPHSTTELAYLPMGTASNNAAFKVYTDNALFGSSIVATQYMTAQQFITIQFRGII